MESTTYITLNLQQPNIAAIAYAVQNDRLSRHILAQLVDGSQAWTPPAGAAAMIRFLKPDGTSGFYDTDEAGDPAVVIDGSTATLTLAEQALTVPGDVVMQLNFYTPAGEKLTTLSWLLRVQKSVLTDDTIISTDYYNILSEQIAAVLTAAESLTGMTATASGLPTGSNPTVNVTGGSGGNPYNLAFGIPAGATGPQGPQGPPGQDGQGAPGTETPLMDGVAAVGTSVRFAHEDHRHPRDTSRLAALASAQAYSSGGTYSLGDLCIYNDGLYRCIYPILSAEAWTAAHWSATSIEEQLAGIPLSGRKILLLGDSYNYGNGGITGRGWGYYFDQLNGTTSTIIHQNTGGFAAVANSANASYNNCNYADVIDQLSTSDAFDLIVAQAGWNDASTSKNPGGVAAIQTAVASFVEKCRAKWPGCEIVIVATNNDALCNDYKVSCLNAIVDTARASGVLRATRNSFLWLQGTGTNATDNIHLNDDGYQLLGKLIYSYADGWAGDLNNPYTAASDCVVFAQGLKFSWGVVRTDTNGLASVTFPVTYLAPPNVFCYISGVSQNYMFDARSGNPTTTGCDVTAVRLSGSSYGPAANYAVRWVAIGI